MLKIIENNLCTNQSDKSLVLENDAYAIRLSYAGDYTKDKALNQIDRKKLILLSEPKDSDIHIEFINGYIAIDMNGIIISDIEKIRQANLALDKAYDTALELSDILNQYFPK